MMGKRFYTIIVVPHAKAKFRKLRVPYLMLQAAGLVALALVIGIGLLGVRYGRVQSEQDELGRLRKENAELRRENEKTHQITNDIENRLSDFQETVGRFKVLFGVGGESATGVGDLDVGEPPELDPRTRHSAFTYLSSLKAESEDLEAELRALSQDIESRSVVWNATPSIRPVRNGFISSTFGHRLDPFTGRRVFHPAVDISTWYWDEILAPADGIVTRIGRNHGSGNFIEVSHGFGYTTLYAHLNKFAVQEGQEVKRHQVLGYVGSTGRSTGPHLHYEVRYQGKSIDPLPLMLDEATL
jgi:murein DD-endopeptidase MepM/ murein hydrolase activator NlpD